MNKTILLAFVVFCCSIGIAFAQENDPISWSARDAYQPNPVLLVHGIARDSQDAWGGASGMVDKLNDYYSSYYSGMSFTPQVGTPSNPYLHAFDYAENPVSGSKTYEGTFDSVRENAWDKEYSLQRAVTDVEFGYKKDVVLVGHGIHIRKGNV